MGTVLLWILGILLGIVLLALVIVLMLLNIRAGIEAVGVTGEVSVEARYGPVRIPLYPRPRHLKKKKEETEAEQKKSEENEKKTSGKLGLSLPKDGLDVGEIAGTVRDFLSDLTDRLRISRLRARVVIGTDDAAQTGILLGQTAALCGIVVPFLENTFDMQDYHVSADADFNADHTEWAFTVNCSIRPISLIRVLLRHGKPMYQLYKKYFK